MTRPPLAEHLDLAPHPEGGWFRETWRSELELPRGVLPGYPGARSAGTAIYFVLGPGERSAWHRVRSAELWFWHRGGPLIVWHGGTGDVPDSDRAVATVLGSAVDRGEQPQLLIPPGEWQSAQPAKDEEVLVSCVVVPGFDFADFTLTAR